jgi:hypothetical protein
MRGGMFILSHVRVLVESSAPISVLHGVAVVSNNRDEIGECHLHSRLSLLPPSAPSPVLATSRIDEFTQRLRANSGA